MEHQNGHSAKAARPAATQTESASKSTEAKSAQPRRWFDFWPMLVPIVLIGGLLWISLWYKHRSRLLDDGGYVEFNAPTWGWLEAMAGPEIRTLVASPTHLRVAGERPSTTDLRMIAGFSELIDFSASEMTDDDLGYLLDCPKIESLHLAPSSLTEAGFRKLSDMKGLRHLDVTTNQPLTADAFAALVQLPNLESLYIHAEGLTDAEFAPIAELQSLKQIGLTGASIQGDGLKHLAALPKLQWIFLSHCEIGEDALAALKPSLEAPRLNLHESNLSDAHLSSLRTLSWLLSVDLTGTEVTNEACLALKRDRPGMQVINAQGKLVKLPSANVAP